MKCFMFIERIFNNNGNVNIRRFFFFVCKYLSIMLVLHISGISTEQKYFLFIICLVKITQFLHNWIYRFYLIWNSLRILYNCCGPVFIEILCNNGCKLCKLCILLFRFMILSRWLKALISALRFFNVISIFYNNISINREKFTFVKFIWFRRRMWKATQEKDGDVIKSNQECF